MAEKSRGDITVREYGFNMIASDKVSMTRTIPDTRLDEYVRLTNIRRILQFALSSFSHTLVALLLLFRWCYCFQAKIINVKI